MKYVNCLKVLLTFTIIIVFHFLGFAQSDYFTSIIAGPRDGDYAWSVNYLNDGYAYCSGTFSYDEQIGSMAFGKIDLNGKKLWSKKWVKFPQIQCDALINSECCLYLAGNKHVLRPDMRYQNLRPFIIKVNQNGDTIWEKDFGESIPPNSAIQSGILAITFNEHFIYFLEANWNNDTIGKSTYLLITKIDTNGLVLWKTRLNSTNPPKTFQPISRYLQFDQQGNILVCVSVDTAYSQGEAVPYTGIISPEGKILNEGKLYPLELNAIGFTFYPINGAFSKNHTAVWISPYEWNEGLLLYAFDSTRKKIWRTVINSPWEAIYYPSIFGWSNGDMIGLYETAERFQNFKPRGSGLLRISQNGQVKWKRRYYMFPWTDKSPIELNFGAVDETEDGGIIVSGGYVFMNQWREIDQDVLLVKLDSMGCPYKDCTESDTIIILKETVTITNDVSQKNLYKWKFNGDHSQLMIQFEQGIRKPDLDLDLISLDGKTISKHKLASFENEINIPLNGLLSGMYFIQMKSGKLIKVFKFTLF